MEINNKVTLDELCLWYKNPEKAKKLLPLNIIKQKESINEIIG